MRKSLAESEREELLAELTEAHNVVSKVLSELRSRYSVKSPTMEAAIKAEWAVFHLKRELLRMDVEKTPPRTPLPKVQRGGKVVDVEELQGSPERLISTTAASLPTSPPPDQQAVR